MDRTADDCGLLDDARRALRESEPEAIARTVRLIALVVHDRGYAIPVADRPDVIQNAIADVWRAVSDPGFRFHGNLDTFVRTVAYRRCVDWMRRQRARESLDDEALPAAAGSADALLLDAERFRLGREALSRLGAACLELLQLRAVRRLSHTEIAERQQRSEGAVRSHFYRCMKRARQIYAALRDSTPGEC